MAVSAPFFSTVKTSAVVTALVSPFTTSVLRVPARLMSVAVPAASVPGDATASALAPVNASELPGAGIGVWLDCEKIIGAVGCGVGALNAIVAPRDLDIILRVLRHQSLH